MNQAELPLTSAPALKIICLRLTREQAEQLAPLTIDAARNRENVLFVSVVVPNWSAEGSTWELQAIRIPAKIGHKIKALLLQAQKPVAKNLP
jgi:hypothetical protein